MDRFSNIIIKFKSEKLLVDAFKVLSGSVLAQALPIAVLPILTRNVSNDILGLYFVWLGVSNILVVLATGRLDMAVFVVNTKYEVANLLKLIVCFAALISLCFVILVGFIMPLFNLQFGNPIIENHFFKLALLTFFLAVFQGVTSYYIYYGKYVMLGWVKFSLAFIVNLAVLIASIVGSSINSILYSHLISTIILVFVLVTLTKMQSNFFGKYSKVELISTLKRHYRFPLFSMPADFINSFSAQLPLFLIMTKFGNAPVAYFGMTLRVLSGPIGLLASSMLTVFKEQAGRDFREIGNCKSIYLRTLKLLVFTGIIPFLILFIFSPNIFTLLFGQNWKEAGDYARILTPMFFLKFVVSPLSYTLYISDKQLNDLIWQILLLLTTFGAFYLTNSIYDALVSYSVGYSILYLIYLFMSFNSVTNLKFK